MLEYMKLFEDDSRETINNNTSVLSSIKEERESKEEQFTCIKRSASKTLKNKYDKKISLIDSSPLYVLFASFYRKKKQELKNSFDIDSQDLNYEVEKSVSSMTRVVTLPRGNTDTKSRDGLLSTGNLVSRKDLVSSVTDFDREPAKPLSAGEPEQDQDLEQEILDVAEGVFVKISDIMKANDLTIREFFNEEPVKQLKSDSGKTVNSHCKVSMYDFGKEKHEIISPNDFMKIFKTLGINDLGQNDIECVLQVLIKTDLDSDGKPLTHPCILMSELVSILENFGVPE